MKILAMMHACVTGVNQELFVRLNDIPGVQVELIVPSKWKNAYTGKMMESQVYDRATFPIHRLPVAAPGSIPLHFYTSLPLAKLRNYKPDVVFAWQDPFTLSALQAALLAKWLDAAFVFRGEQNIVKNYPLPFAKAEQFVFKQSDVSFACAEEVRTAMLSKGLKSDCHIVPYGLDLGLFYPQDTSALRSELGLKGLVIGNMGRLVSEKGLDTLLDAAALLAKDAEAPEFSVVIVGSGPEDKALKDQAKSLGISDKVVFTGSVPHDQAGRFMNLIDIFALCSKTRPNWREQFGRVIIESMACQIPLVGSNSGSIPLLAKQTGGGLVFQEADPADLASKLKTLLLDPSLRESLGKAGERVVREKYTYDAVAHQIKDLLELAVAQHAAPSGGNAGRAVKVPSAS